MFFSFFEYFQNKQTFHEISKHIKLNLSVQSLNLKLEAHINTKLEIDLYI